MPTSPQAMYSISSLTDSVRSGPPLRVNSHHKTPRLGQLLDIQVRDPSGRLQAPQSTHSLPRSPRRSIASQSLSITQMSVHTASRSTRHPPSRRTPLPGADAGASKAAPKKSARACCTVPIVALFATACAVIAAAFTAITTKSSLDFTAEVNTRVQVDLSSSVEAMMKYVTDPLEETVAYVNQMKLMMDTKPEFYQCDDANPTAFPGNASNGNFLYDAGMYGYQRQHLHAIFQMRESRRFGGRGVGCVVYPDVNTTLRVYANGSMLETSISHPSELEGLEARNVGAPTAADLAALPEYDDVLNATEATWYASATTVDGQLMTRYTYVKPVVDPTNPNMRWAVGVDHDMSDLLTYLLEGTPPISLGDTHSVPTQVAGAHTTLYDMTSGTLLSSTHAGMPLVDGSGRLFATNAAPVSEVNDAYRDALARCPGNDSCYDRALVTIEGSVVHVAYRVNYADSDLHLLVVTCVPREYFFAEADKTFRVTLGLSIGCCVLVVGGCVALLLLIQRPLSSLQDNMVLAAELHNDRVEHTTTYLRDIARLSAVFDGMNQQLLIARSFVPEAVLLGRSEDSQEDAGDEGSMSCGDTGSVATARVVRGVMQHDEPESTMEGTEMTATTTSSGGMSKLFNVSEKRVGVLSLNLVGFHVLCAPHRQASRAQRIQEVSTELLSLAVACAHRERGVMDSFHGDHFVLTYNASRAVGTPLAAAVRSGNLFIEEVRGCDVFDGCGGVAAGAAAGRAVVGTFGIDGYRRLSVVGEAYRSAVGLQQAAVQFLRMNRDLVEREGCVVDGLGAKELGSCAFHLQLVGCVQGGEDRAGCGKGVPSHAYLALGVDECCVSGRAANEADGEWLYELDAIGASDPYVEANQALVSLMEGDAEACGAALVRAQAGVGAAVGEESSGGVGGVGVLPSTSSSGSLRRSSEDVVSPAWRLVRGHYAHHQGRAGGGAMVTEAQAMMATTRQCGLPWLLFKQ